MSLIDMMAQFGKISAEFEKNKGVLAQLPQILEQWSQLQIAIAANSKKAADGVEQNQIALERIISLLEPGGVTPALLLESQAIAEHDPRQASVQVADYQDGTRDGV